MSTTASRSGSRWRSRSSSAPRYGAVVELVVVRRLFRAPRVILLVATIGVAQLSLLILNAYPDVVGEAVAVAAGHHGDVERR